MRGEIEREPCARGGQLRPAGAEELKLFSTGFRAQCFDQLLAQSFAAGFPGDEHELTVAFRHRSLPGKPQPRANTFFDLDNLIRTQHAELSIECGRGDGANSLSIERARL